MMSKTASASASKTSDLIRNPSWGLLSDNPQLEQQPEQLSQLNQGTQTQIAQTCQRSSDRSGLTVVQVCLDAGALLEHWFPLW